MTGFLRILVLGMVAVLGGARAGEVSEPPTRISVATFYDPNRPDGPTTKRLRQFTAGRPDIRLEQWGGLQIGGNATTPLVMSIAGGTAPDIMPVWFHLLRSNIHQGFLTPLNRWIGDDLDGDGEISPAEARWKGWGDIHPLWRQVATVDGNIYAIPQTSAYYMAVIYRTDLIRAAGLDPRNPPQTWEELRRWCMRLSHPDGRRGIALTPYGFTWLPWVQAAGGSPIVQIRTSPTTGVKHTFPMEADTFITPDGENLAGVPSVWKADFTSPAALEATEYIHRLRWGRWVKDDVTGDGFDVAPEDEQRGWIDLPDGRRLAFKPADVLVGVGRPQTDRRGEGQGEMLARGDVAMMAWLVNDLFNIGQNTGLNPDLLSWFPYPASGGPEGRRVVLRQAHYASLSENVARRPAAEQDKVWDALVAITDPAARDEQYRSQIRSGLARFVDPADLERLGFADYLRDIPLDIRDNYQAMRDGRISVHTEPFMGFWVTMDGQLNSRILGLLLAETGEDFDWQSELHEVERAGNDGLMFARPPEELERYRPWARGIFTVCAVIVLGFSVLAIRTFWKGAGKGRGVYRGWFPWLLLAPALLAVGVWSYYPLLRGFLMAFQDYRITGASPWVGLDNFITLALDPSWWASLGRTAKFAAISLSITFVAPILLAFLLSEVPRGKIMYRLLFFLPNVTSAVVVALLWKLMYDPTPAGFLNQIISWANLIPFVDIPRQTWLQDPALAMLCCVLPTAWATVGMSSLIYLAALHSIPNDLYEAADLDGAGMLAKIRHVTLPTILPLVLINFVGAFIATFQNMGHIFLLTFGGPGETTMVAGMRIWIEAYANLRFGMATSMAWMLGTILVGFAYLQIRLLRRVEFRRAENV